MKKCIAIAVMIVVGAVFSATSSFSATCGVMSVVSTAASTNAASGAEVWLKNETSEACGTIPAGGQKLFNLAPETSDKSLAVILTAMSLGKNLWCAFDDSTDPGLLQIISMQN